MKRLFDVVRQNSVLRCALLLSTIIWLSGCGPVIGCKETIVKNNTFIINGVTISGDNDL